MGKHQTITVRGAIALGVGSMVGAGIFALMGEAAGKAGGAVWLSFLVAGIIALREKLRSQRSGGMASQASSSRRLKPSPKVASSEAG